MQIRGAVQKRLVNGIYVNILRGGVLQENGVVLRDKIEEKPLALRWIFYLFVITFLLVFGIYGPGFDASSFVYFSLEAETDWDALTGV